MGLNKWHWPKRRTRRHEPPQTPWQPTNLGGIRVLLECPPEESPDIVASVLEQEGFDVVVCHGPADHERCPMAVGEYCGALQGADVVLNMLGSGSAQRAEVLAAVARGGPRPPAIVAMTDGPELELAGVETVSRNAPGAEIVEALRQALERSRRQL